MKLRLPPQPELCRGKLRATNDNRNREAPISTGTVAEGKPIVTSGNQWKLPATANVAEEETVRIVL